MTTTIVISMMAAHREKQSGPPSANLCKEVYLNLCRCASVLGADFAALFRAHDLSDPAYNLLRILGAAGGKPVPCNQIGRRMLTRVPDVTRLVDRLADRGLVDRARATDDRRVVHVSITRKGAALLESLEQPVLAAHRRQLAHMTTPELRELAALLGRVRKGGAGKPD